MAFEAVLKRFQRVSTSGGLHKKKDKLSFFLPYLVSKDFQKGLNDNVFIKSQYFQKRSFYKFSIFLTDKPQNTQEWC